MPMITRTPVEFFGLNSDFHTSTPDNVVDILPLAVLRQSERALRLAVSATRFVLRQYDCSHYPQITALALATKADSFGNQIICEVRYGARDYTTPGGYFVRGSEQASTLIAGHVLDDNSIKWEVYMD